MSVIQDKPHILQPFTLPCGASLKNRIAKAAMTERLAGGDSKANKWHSKLYRKWSESGAGLLITGNVMIDRRYKESSGNIVIEDESGLKELQSLTANGLKSGNHIWAQINHPGRQATIFSTFKPIAPSAVQLKKLMLFAKPRAMTIKEIENVIDRFVNTAVICKKAGFTGVQIHAAHGYLISQFLSPKTNLRNDDYGGSIENRSRILTEVISRLKIELGPHFPISVKLNSADFQRGGFNEKDALYVIENLQKLKIDLLEISGGTYENTVFLTKRSERESTRKREAYFMDFAAKIRKHTKIPLMVTGGFRTFDFCEQVLQNRELDIIGFARPFLNDERFPLNFINGDLKQVQDAKFNFKIKKLADFAEAGFYDYQIHRIARGKPLNSDYNPYFGVLRFTKNELLKGWF